MIEVQGEPIDLLCIEDLVWAKKTQQDKAWPMIRRLVERFYLVPAQPAVSFWLLELRTAELLVEAAAAYPDEARPLLTTALTGDIEAVSDRLVEEERDARLRDRDYWKPLKRELEMIRRRKDPVQADSSRCPIAPFDKHPWFVGDAIRQTLLFAAAGPEK